MKTKLLAALGETTNNLISALVNQNDYIYAFEGEPDPSEIDLSFIPAIKIETADVYVDTSLCTLCSRRVSYKANQFTETPPKLPYLIVLFNTFITGQNKYYHDSRTDLMFQNIISKTLGHSPEEFLIREALRCHFGAEDLRDPQNIKNCMQNMQDDIIKFNLKGILILGAAAPMLFNKEQLNKRVGYVTDFLGLPTVVSPGPSRLVYMQTHNFDHEKILTEKKKIFQAVKLFKDQVITTSRD